jgi:hypothetical protein
MLIGCGGTASILAPHLARLLSYHPASDKATLILADGDELEEHNLTRQNFGTAHVGRNKAHILHDHLEGLGLINTTAWPKYINTTNIGRWLDAGKAVRLVIAAVDNDRTRHDTLAVLQSSGVDYVFITPGNSDITERPRGQVFWCGKVGDESLGLDLLSLYPNLQSPSDIAPTSGGCIEHAPSQPQLITSNMLAAAWTLAVVQNLLDLELDAAHHAVYYGVRNLTAKVS